MKRSSFWTFLFSFCPGAGQMYQGYMKRGLSLILLFILPIMVGAAFMPVLAALSAVVYMYSFFDSLNLSAQLRMGEIPQDDFIIHLDFGESDVKKLLSGKTHLIGWCFVGLGVIGIYKTVVEPMLQALVDLIPYENPLHGILWSLAYQLPGVAVGIVFILVGLWLVKGGKHQKPEEFEEYKGED